jgi:uncharacterized protein
MNQISVESNVVEIECNEPSALSITQMEDAITELNSAQLLLIGGGCAAISLG